MGHVCFGDGPCSVFCQYSPLNIDCSSWSCKLGGSRLARVESLRYLLSCSQDLTIVRENKGRMGVDKVERVEKLGGDAKRREADR